MIQTAVILAAGLGSRLKNKINGLPKGFLVVGSKPIIEESLDKLRAAGIKKIIIGTGHRFEKYDELASWHPEIICRKNDLFAVTGSMHTLYCLKDIIDTDFLLLESDLIYDGRGLSGLLGDGYPNSILASGITHSGDEVFVEMTEERFLVNLSKKGSELGKIDGELVGISKISQEAFLSACSFYETHRGKMPRIDYENALVGIAQDIPIFVNKIDDYLWCEIDDEKHFNRAFTDIYPKIRGDYHEEKKRSDFI